MKSTTKSAKQQTIRTTFLVLATILCTTSCSQLSDKPSDKNTSAKGDAKSTDTSAGDSAVNQNGSKDGDGKDDAKDGNTGEKEAEISLPTSKVHRTSVTQAVSFPGKVSALPDCSVSVSPNIAGKLIEVAVVPGQNVTKGQLIAKLDDRQLRAQLLTANAPQAAALNGVAQAKINLDLAQKNLNRTEGLYGKEIVAQKDLVAARSASDLAKSQVEAAESKVKEAKAAPSLLLTQLSFMSVRSPITGVVAQRFLNAGSSVDVTTPIVHVVNLNQVMVNANMPADAPIDARVGQTAEITTVAEPGVIHHGKIMSVSPTVDTANNTVSVEVLVKNDGHLKEGQQVTVAISTARINAILVPDSAIVPGHDDPSENFIYVVVDGKVKLTKVKLGTKSGTSVPVLSGLDDNAEIVTSGSYGIADGATLKRQSSDSEEGAEASNRGENGK